MDSEIEAMSKVAEALRNVDESIQQRVIRWAAERYGVVFSVTRKQRPEDTSSSREEIETDEGEPSGPLATIADLFVAAKPGTGPEKVLVATYWLQVLQKNAGVTSFAVNQELKDLGHAVSSINKVFDALMEQKPQLAVQLKKGGTSKQARKTYKLTHAGIEKVKTMLKNPETPE